MYLWLSLNQKKISLEQAVKLVSQLPQDEQEELRVKLNSKTWGERWQQLIKDIHEDNKGLPPISDEEIAEEITTYRREQRSKRAQSSS